MEATVSESFQSTENSNDFFIKINEEELRQAQTALSELIDQTCDNDSSSQVSIFENLYTAQDCFAYLFRSLIPTPSSLQNELESELPANFFKYEDQNGMKYTFKVLDRRTNRLTYEQMPSYHKYGMRLLFCGPVQRELLHTNTMRNFFARETLRLGRAFDEPKSRKHIPAFVKMYQIDLNELLEPNLTHYFTFNEFFYRKLKADARPIDRPNDSNGIVSAADCRLILFDQISDATRIWIKGTNFSLESLFNDPKLAEEFQGGSIAVFRLAPVDYHRFHSPVTGTIGNLMKKINGTFYTVNPIAIKEKLDILTRNQRTVITIENPLFDKIAFVAIGALLVGSVNFTVKSGQNIFKGDELGYFAYGGSTIVVVFKAGVAKWDEDLRHNSDNSMETLVRMGEHIGEIRNEDERREYLSKRDGSEKKNATITQLLANFPILNVK